MAIEWERRDLPFIHKITGPIPPPRFKYMRFGDARLLSFVPQAGRYRIGWSVTLWVRPLYYTGTNWLSLMIGPLVLRTRERTDHERGVREDKVRRGGR